MRTVHFSQFSSSSLNINRSIKQPLSAWVSGRGFPSVGLTSPSWQLNFALHRWDVLAGASFSAFYWCNILDWRLFQTTCVAADDFILKWLLLHIRRGLESRRDVISVRFSHVSYSAPTHSCEPWQKPGELVWVGLGFLLCLGLPDILNCYISLPLVLENSSDFQLFSLYSLLWLPLCPLMLSRSWISSCVSSTFGGAWHSVYLDSWRSQPCSVTLPKGMIL